MFRPDIKKKTSDLSGEPSDPDLGHEVGEALAGLELVGAEHLGGQLVGRGDGGEEEEEEEHLCRPADCNSGAQGGGGG